MLARLFARHARTYVAWAATITAAFAWLSPTASGPVVGAALFLGGAWAAWADARRGRRAAGAALGGIAVLGLGGLCALLAASLAPALGRGATLVPLGLAVVLLLTNRPGVGRLVRLASVEGRKMVRGRLFRTGLLATAGLTLLATLTYDVVPGATGWTRAAHGFGVGQWVSTVFLLVLGATALAGEATGGTLKMMLPHAYLRSDWILAKAGILAAAAVLFCVVSAGASLLPAAVQDGLGHVETEPLFGESPDSVEIFATASEMGRRFGATVLAEWASTATMALLGLFLSTLFDGVVAALSSSFLVFAGIRLADVVLVLPQADLVHRLFAWSPVVMRDTLGKLGRGLSERWDPTLLATTLGLAAVTSALLVLLATRIFRTRDVHA